MGVWLCVMCAVATTPAAADPGAVARSDSAVADSGQPEPATFAAKDSPKPRQGAQEQPPLAAPPPSGSGPGVPDEATSELIWRSQRVCGVNCLYVLLQAHGRAVDYRGLSDDLLTSDDLTSLTSLKTASAARGLKCQIGKTDVEGLRDLPKPIIMHFDLLDGRGNASGHFVTVIRCDESGLTYLDGTTATIERLSWRSVKRLWSGYILFVGQGTPMSWYWYSAASLILTLTVCFVIDRFLPFSRVRDLRR